MRSWRTVLGILLLSLSACSSAPPAASATPPAASASATPPAPSAVVRTTSIADEILRRADPTRLDPGKGMHGIVVGKSTPDDVLRVFGADGEVSKGGDGSVNRITYRGKPGAVPDEVTFEAGVVESLIVDRRELHTGTGLSVGSSEADVEKALGPPGQVTGAPSGDVHWYDAGIRFVMDRGQVNRIIVERAHAF
ncbi:MAG: hypothetical protein U0414_31485 [Polyangiaceae bacterium]